MGININSIYSGITAQIKNFLLKNLPGMNNKVNDLNLETKWAQLAQNARFEDTPGAVDKRNAVSFYNPVAITSAPVTGLFRYYTSTGEDLWVSTCGTEAVVGNDVAGSFTPIRTGLTTGKRTQFVVYQDLLIGSNGFDNMWVFDGSDFVTWELGACKALVNGATGSMGNGTYFYAVTIGSADEFTCGAVSNSVQTQSTGGLDNEVVLLLHCNGSDKGTTFTDSSSSAKTVTDSALADINTVLLLHMDGTNLGQTFTDSETTPKTVTANTNVMTSTTQKVFGTAAAYFNPGLDQKTVVMLHMDGSDSGTTFTDTEGPIWTAHGNAQTKTGTKHFGTASGNFDGTNSYITTPSSTNYDFSFFDFTIDFWIKQTTNSTTQFLVNRLSGANNVMNIVITSSNTLAAVFYNTGGVSSVGDYVTTSSFDFTDTFHHVAFVRTGANFYILVDGVNQVLTVNKAFGAGVAIGAGDSVLYVGASSGSSNFLAAYIDEFRISYNCSRWTANFQVPLTPYSTGDWLSIPDSSDWTFGAGDFTIDCWVYINAYTNMEPICEQFVDFNNWMQFFAGGGGLQFAYLVSGSILTAYFTPSTFLNLGQWYHLAAVRSGTNFNIYVNGVSQTLTATTPIGSTSLPDFAAGFDIGKGTSGGNIYFFDGFIDEFRVTKGVSRWKSNFVAPVYSYGHVVTSTSTKELGSASAYIPGGGECLSLASSVDFDFGAGDFTIDFWANNQVASTGSCFFARTASTNSISCITGKIDTGNLISFFAEDGSLTHLADYNTVSPVNLFNGFNHIAFVRSGSNFFIFVNGISQPLTTNTAIGSNSLYAGDSAFIVGAQNLGNNGPVASFYGYIDEFRVSKGIARWTSNFTPPAVEYTASGNTSVTLTHIPLGPAGTPARIIYRTDANGSTLKLLHTLSDNTTTTYIDTIADGSLGASYPSVTDDMPRGALLQIHRERLFVSGDPSNSNYIYYSATYLPHYIQQTTQLTFMAIEVDDGDIITGIPIQLGVMVCVKRNSIRILHITSPVSGADPTTWYADDPIAWIGSPAPYSVTQTPEGIYFLGYDHWYIFDGASVQPKIDEFNTEFILQSAYNDTVAYYNNGIFLAAYTDFTSAAQFHNRIMRWNLRRAALAVDTWTSSTLSGANCFAGRIGDSEQGDLFYGDSVNGYVVKDQNSENVYSLISQTDANLGTLNQIFIGGNENAPSIQIGVSDVALSIPNDICIFWDNPTTNPGAGWTEITGYNGSTILVSNSVVPLTTDQGQPHSHTITGAIPVWTGNTVNAGDGNPGAVAAHTHVVSASSDPSTPLPRCVFLRMFKKNSNTTEYEFPDGAIIMYDQASTPDGWQSLNSEGFNGYYIVLNQAGTAYAFAVTGISTWPSVGDTYTNNGSVFTISFSPLSGSQGIIYATSSSGDPSTNGVLTKTTGSGDSSISFNQWTSQTITLNSTNSSNHIHTFDIPTSTAAGSLAQSDSGTNCPAFGHDHVIVGELASTNMDSWEVPFVGFNFIKKVGLSDTWDGTNRYAYCLFAGTEPMTNGWTDATASYSGKYLKIVSTAPTTGGQAGQTHTHIAGTFTTSTENALWGNSGYRATCYAGPHTHLVTLSASTESNGNPPSVSFYLGKKLLGQMKAYNDAILVPYTSGTYDSAPQQINALSLDKIFWNQSITGPTDTIQFYVRTGATQSACTMASYSGPYTNPNGSDISAVPAAQWFQYRIVFSAANSTIANPSVYFTNGYAVQYTYAIGAVGAEDSVNFVYSIGLRNFDTPSADKIFKKISSTHVGSAGSFVLGWTTENSANQFTVSLASNPTYWDSYFQSSAYGKEVNLTVTKNDLFPLKIKQFELLYSPAQVIV